MIDLINFYQKKVKSYLIKCSRCKGTGDPRCLKPGDVCTCDVQICPDCGGFGFLKISF